MTVLVGIVTTITAPQFESRIKKERTKNKKKKRWKERKKKKKKGRQKRFDINTYSGQMCGAQAPGKIGGGGGGGGGAGGRGYEMLPGILTYKSTELAEVVRTLFFSHPFV